MCMGDYKNMQFNVELICEGNDYTAAVNWHLGIFFNLSLTHRLALFIKQQEIFGHREHFTRGTTQSDCRLEKDTGPFHQRMQLLLTIST